MSTEVEIVADSVSPAGRKRRHPDEIRDLARGLRCCKDCGAWKPFDCYCPGHGSADGLASYCRDCSRERQIKARRSAGVPQQKRSRIEGDFKLCMHCGVMKHLSCFSPTTRGLGGVSAYCRPCQSARYLDRAKSRVQSARWRKENPERWKETHRLHQFKRRFKQEASNDGTVTRDFLMELYASEVCHYCRKSTPQPERTADHLTPLSRGGEHSASNLAMACFACNSSKQDKTEAEYRSWLDGKRS